MLLDQIDTLTAQIATLTSRIEQLLAAMPDTRSRGDGGPVATRRPYRSRRRARDRRARCHPTAPRC